MILVYTYLKNLHRYFASDFNKNINRITLLFNSLHSVTYRMFRNLLVFYWTFVINADHHYCRTVIFHANIRFRMFSCKINNLKKMFWGYRIHLTGFPGKWARMENIRSPVAGPWGREQGEWGHLLTTIAVCSPVSRTRLLNKLDFYIF